MALKLCLKPILEKDLRLFLAIISAFFEPFSKILLR